MAPYVGEIRMFAGNFAPVGWMFCQGQTLSIAENEVLFQLIGTTYGGDGQTTFNLPNLASRVPVHMGTSNVSGRTYIIGEMAGVEQVTLTVQQIPNHTHTALASSAPGNSRSLNGGAPARDAEGNLPLYSTPSFPSPVNLNAGTIGIAGGSQPHENMQPFVCMNYIISLYGIYPSTT